MLCTHVKSVSFNSHDSHHSAIRQVAVTERAARPSNHTQTRAAMLYTPGQCLHSVSILHKTAKCKCEVTLHLLMLSSPAGAFLPFFFFLNSSTSVLVRGRTKFWLNCLFNSKQTCVKQQFSQHCNADFTQMVALAPSVLFMQVCSQRCQVQITSDPA